jgi:hypothetical protein
METPEAEHEYHKDRDDHEEDKEQDWRCEDKEFSLVPPSQKSSSERES